MFPGLAAGRYTLTAQRNGYLSQGYGARSGSTSSSPLVLAAGQQLKDVLLKLVPAAVISGRVFDENGEPPEDMGVAAFQSRYQRGVRQWVRAGVAQANTLGEFRITNLAGGSYLVATYNLRTLGNDALSAQAPGDEPELEYVLTFFPSATDAASAMPVQVATGAEAGGTEIRLQKADTVRIRGKVIGAGEGTSVLVQLVPRGVTDGTMASWQGKRVIVHPPGGTFELKGIMPGTYLLSTQFRVGQTVFLDSLSLPVSGQHIDGLVIRPVAAPDLVGAVVVADQTSVKPNSVQVALEAKEYFGLGSPSASAVDDGKFTLKSVRPVQYHVQVRNLPEGAYVKSVRFGAQEVTEDGIDLTNGISGNLQVTLSLTGAQVDGVVQGADDKPVSGATVVLVPDSRRYSLFAETLSGKNGSYSLKGIAPGEYKILAWEDIQSGIYQDPEFLKRYESKAERVSLQEGDRKSLSLKVTLHKAE